MTAMSLLPRISLLGGILLLAGCGQTYQPVTGILTLDGQPLAGASISFIPDGPGQPGVATTDATGHYTLETNNSKGVMPGAYKIVVVQMIFKQGNERTLNASKPIPSPIPAKYAKLETSGLKITVPNRGDGGYDVKLTTK